MQGCTHEAPARQQRGAPGACALRAPRHAVRPLQPSWRFVRTFAAEPHACLHSLRATLHLLRGQAQPRSSAWRTPGHFVRTSTPPL